MENKAWWQPALILFAKFSVWIGLPALVGAFVGKWLDEKYGSEPFMLLACVGFAFLISMFGLIREVKEASRDDKEKQDDKRFDSKDKRQ